MKKNLTGFKGFNPNFTCRDFQFAVGQSYTHKGSVSLCNTGFHFCENPLDIFNYYPPSTSKFAEVEAEGVSDSTDSDSKRVCSKLHIKAEITLNALIQGGVKFILDKVNFKDAKEGCAISIGIEGKTRGKTGCFLTLAEWEQREGNWHRIDVQSVRVDGKKIKEDTFYTLKGGKFTAAE